jgi:hypothetical protein
VHKRPEEPSTGTSGATRSAAAFDRGYRPVKGEPGRDSLDHIRLNVRRLVRRGVHGMKGH